MRSPHQRRPQRSDGFRSGLEAEVARQLKAANLPVEYEKDKLRYRRPSREQTYLTDFCVSREKRIYIETKGRFVAKDRQKHLCVKESNPSVEVRFVFSRSASPIYKGSKTTYAMWCDANGFKFCDKVIPDNWIIEFTKAKKRRAK